MKMGCFMFFEGSLGFDRKMDREMKKKVNSFIKVSHLAKDAPYGTACPWWINKEDRLILGCTKFGDHHVWLDYLIDHYFEPEGYNVQGVLIESGECGPRDIISVNNKEWKYLRSEINKLLDEFLKSVYNPEDRDWSEERGTAYVWTADMLTEADMKHK